MLLAAIAPFDAGCVESIAPSRIRSLADCRMFPQASMFIVRRFVGKAENC